MICAPLFHWYEPGFGYIKMHGGQMKELIFVYNFFFFLEYWARQLTALQKAGFSSAHELIHSVKQEVCKSVTC